MSEHPKDLTTHQLTNLAEVHIAHYQKMIATGSHYVRVDECRMYIAIWEATLFAVAKEGARYRDLPKINKGEINDAVESGDYDALLEAWKAEGPAAPKNDEPSA